MLNIIKLCPGEGEPWFNSTALLRHDPWQHRLLGDQTWHHRYEGGEGGRDGGLRGGLRGAPLPGRCLASASSRHSRAVRLRSQVSCTVVQCSAVQRSTVQWCDVQVPPRAGQWASCPHSCSSAPPHPALPSLPYLS